MVPNWLSWVLEPVNISDAYSRRVNSLLAKTYSAALLLSVVELSINAARQYSLLNPFWFWLTWALVVAPAAGMFIAAYFFTEKAIWYGLHAFAVLFTVLSWPLQTGIGAVMPEDFTPWIWWNLGMGSMSAGFGLRRQIRWIFIAVLPICLLYTSDAADE